MGAILGTYPERGEHVQWMQEQMPHRGRPVLDPGSVEGCNALHHPDTSGDSRIASRDGVTVAIDGRVLNKAEVRGTVATPKSDAAVLADHYADEGVSGFDRVRGGFAAAVHEEDGVTLYRDVLGLQPLYYGVSDDGRFFYASEAKALLPWVESVSVVPPGTAIDERGNVTAEVDRLSESRPVPNDPEEAALKLREHVERAVDRRLKRTDEAYTFLSGGLDSSIVTALLAERVDTLHTFSVGTEGSEDLQFARRMAEYVGSEHHEEIFEEDELIEVLPNVIYYFETFVEDFMRAGIGTYLVSRLAAKAGTNYVFCGEGPDEVLGGYTDVRATVDDPETFESATERITRDLHKGGGLRLERMTAAHKLEYSAPFLDRDVVRYGLNIPPEWKVYGDDEVEKWILRTAFEDMLPDDIAWRPKDPFATGSGAMGVAEQLAEKREVHDESSFDHGDPTRPLSEQDALYFDLFQQFYDREKMTDMFARWDPFEDRFEE